jgi:shikimate kinase
MMRFAWGRDEPAAGDDAEAHLIRERLGKRSIVLIGMPGCGKSALGRRLAPRLELPFVDVDEEIERAAGKTIKEIFADHGEACFRDGERKVIARLLASGPQVLATGGGALQAEETRANIRRSGVALWVKADLPLLVRRVTKRTTRPLFEGRDPEVVVKDLMDARYPLYETVADLTVQSRDMPHEIIVGEMIAALARCPRIAEQAADSEAAAQ